LGAGDGDFGLLFVVHPQLVRALEPGHHFLDALGIHQIGAVDTPEEIRVEAIE
jgi:hypothetical protein